MYINYPGYSNGRCPSCGYCPCCGRSNNNHWNNPFIYDPTSGNMQNAGITLTANGNSATAADNSLNPQ